MATFGQRQSRVRAQPCKGPEAAPAPAPSQHPTGSWKAAALHRPRAAAQGSEGRERAGGARRGGADPGPSSVFHSLDLDGHLTLAPSSSLSVCESETWNWPRSSRPICCDLGLAAPLPAPSPSLSVASRVRGQGGKPPRETPGEQLEEGAEMQGRGAAGGSPRHHYLSHFSGGPGTEQGTQHGTGPSFPAPPFPGALPARLR